MQSIMPPKNSNLIPLPESKPDQPKLQNPISLDRSESDCDPSKNSGRGRERLKRHRVEVAGRVWIPELWGQEDFLKDCTVFDAAVRNSGIMSARESLMEEGRRANSRVHNPC